MQTIANAYVPEPQPLHSDVEITALYYPGTEQRAEWDMVEQTRPDIRPLLGWYDEANPENVDWQIKWAVEHGISSFCVDWYWNRGVQRLDHWVKAYYQARYRNYLKWFIMWANHNQVGAHSTQDQIDVTNFWLEHYFKTPEYYTIQGKPVVTVWSLQNLDRDFIDEAARNGETLLPGQGVQRALQISDQMVRKAGLPGIYFIDMYHSWNYEQPLIDIAKKAGYQAQMIYNFDSLALSIAEDKRKPTDKPNSFSYDLVAEAIPTWWNMTSRDTAFPFWPLLPTGWDDTPRSFQLARKIHGRTPEKFKGVCQACKDFCLASGFNHIIIAPLNEWQEGSYIEPNLEYGFQMYDMLRDVFCQKPPQGWPPNLTPQDLGRPLREYPPLPHLDLTAWDFSQSPQGWYRNPYGTGYLKIVDGALAFFRTMPNRAAIRTRIKPFKAQDFTTFHVTMRLTPNPTHPPKGDETMKLYWGTDAHPIFSPDMVISEQNTATLPIIPDGQWHTYTIQLNQNPNWKGRVDELWFDPGNLTQLNVDIKAMAFR